MNVYIQYATEVDTLNNDYEYHGRSHYTSQALIAFNIMTAINWNDNGTIPAEDMKTLKQEFKEKNIEQTDCTETDIWSLAQVVSVWCKEDREEREQRIRREQKFGW